MRISDWSSDVCSPDLRPRARPARRGRLGIGLLMALRPDLAIIADAVPATSRVLDVGCGDGELMVALRGKGIDARGLEIDSANVTAAIARGPSVVQGDANRDLADYPAEAFDYSILSPTLPTTERQEDRREG